MPWRSANGGVAAEALAHDAAERIDVGRRGHLLAADLLGRHVVHRAQRLAGPGEVGALAVLGQAEVGDQRGAVGIEQDVGGLDVAVHHAAGEQRVQPVRDLGADASAVGTSSGPSRSSFCSSEPPSMKRWERYGTPSCSPVSSTGTTCGFLTCWAILRLALEALAEDAVFGDVAAHELKRHRLAVGADRPVDPAHPADAQDRLDPVRPDALCRSADRAPRPCCRVAHGHRMPRGRRGRLFVACPPPL